MGLNVAKTLECISDYWPGKKIMGEILMELLSDFQVSSCGLEEGSDESRKRKVESPLVNSSKTQVT